MNDAWDADLLQVRGLAVNFYVLRDASGLYLLDAGFVGGRWLLQRALQRKGWEREPIRGIIVTHGHLDHILNVAPVAQEHGAWIAAPRLDAEHYAGHPRYRGWSRVTGWMEAVGRPLLGFRPFVPDRWLEGGDVIDVWHGLKAVHLPGHTHGHMGFYCEKPAFVLVRRLLSRHGAFPSAHFQFGAGVDGGQHRESTAVRSRRSVAESWRSRFAAGALAKIGGLARKASLSETFGHRHPLIDS